MLEPYEGKLSRTVLREESGSNPADLLDYRYLTRKLDGEWINAGGSGGRMNPLQIMPPAKNVDDDDDEEPDEFSGLSAMAMHFKMLEIFFTLYLPSIDDIQMSLLKQCCEELYLQQGIDWDTDVNSLKPTDFPIISDLYNLIGDKEKVAAGKEKENLSFLRATLRDIAVGSDSFLWNGHTTIENKNDVISLDTFDLNGASDRVKKAQYFLLLTWCWSQMSRDRSEQYLLICDEAYLMIDPRVPQSLIFLRTLAKRARKYSAALAVVSHSVVDFLDPSIKMYGQALLDTPCYKILMGTDGQNLKETTQLYTLNETEQDLLNAKRRGHALFFAGSRRLHIEFVVPRHHAELFGKAGGF